MACGSADSRPRTASFVRLQELCSEQRAEAEGGFEGVYKRRLFSSQIELGFLYHRIIISIIININLPFIVLYGTGRLSCKAEH